MKFNADLLDFQKQNVAKLSHGRYSLIADEMGLGKTYQALALDYVYRRSMFGPQATERGKTLIFTPLSATWSWADTIEDIFGLVAASNVIAGAGADAKVRVLNPKKRELFGYDAANVQFFIAHWHPVVLEMDFIRNNQWSHIIADEAHYAANRKSKTAKLLKKLKAECKTALTGTPIEEKASDMWSILNWLDGKQFRSYWKFYKQFSVYTVWERCRGCWELTPVGDEVVSKSGKKYCQNAESPRGPECREGLEERGYNYWIGPKNSDELRDLIGEFYVRHLKKSYCCLDHPAGVMPQMPDKYYTKRYTTLTPKQRKHYDEMASDMLAVVDSADGAKDAELLASPIVISQLTRLAQFASADCVVKSTVTRHDNDTESYESTVVMSEPSSKLDVLMELLDELPYGEPVVVFSQFEQMIRLLERRVSIAASNGGTQSTANATAAGGTGTQRKGLSKLKVCDDLVFRDWNASFAKITGGVGPNVRKHTIEQFQAGGIKVLGIVDRAGDTGITLHRSSTAIFLDRNPSAKINKQAEDRLHRIGQENHVQIIDIIARNTVNIDRIRRLKTKAEFRKEILGA